LLFIEKNPEIAGIYNCSSPNPVDNKTLMKTLRRFLKINIGLPTPVWLLKFGAVLIKTEPELILKSRWVVPEKLLMSGYSFRYPTLDSALQEIFHHE
jgi:NAD dependent epimerase/dehydratase family enzyme